MENNELREKLTLDGMLTVSPAPHLRSKETTQRIMLDVIIALVPTTIAAIVIFGMRAAILVFASVLAAVVSEALIQKALKKPVTINDYSAALTGLLLALNVPVSLPVWKLVFGSIFAIVVVKQFFGGLGSNFMNPALAARAMLMASWSKDMGKFTKPFSDLVSTATPLAEGPVPSTMNMFLGVMPGTLGEVSKVCLLVGVLYLLYRKVINLRIPLVYIGTTLIFTTIFGGGVEKILFHLLTGGLILGAFYMATDYATSPVSPKGQIIFAVGCGLITGIIRCFGGYPEGVSYSIIIMNIFVPLIERFTAPKVYGTGGVKVERN